MSTLGQALGMAYANQYGAKYDLPIFGITREDEYNPLSSLDFAAKLSQPVGATPAQDTGVMPPRPIVQDKSFFENAVDYINPFVDSNTKNLWTYLNMFGPVRAGIDVMKDVERWATPQPGATQTGLQSVALPVAQFLRGGMQAASPEQKMADLGNLIFKQVNEKIFNNPFPTPPKLERYADAESAGLSSPGQIGALTGDLAGMIASIATGASSVKTMELPALARTVSTIPGIGGAIAKVAPWLGAETLGGAIGAGLGNAAYSAGNDARSVLEGKEELGHMIAKTGLQGVAGTMFGGAASPNVSLGKKILGEAAVNVLSGVIPAGYDAVTGRTTWLPQRTPTAEAVAKLNAAKASGDPDAIALAAGEADRTATHTLLSAMNSVAGQALMNGLAGALLPLGAAGMKKLGGAARAIPKINPVETPSGAAPVSEAMAPGMAQRAVEDMEAVASFVKNNYRTRDDIANSGMGKNRTEIRQSIIAQANENPAIFQVVKDINEGKATPNDFYATLRGEAPMQTPEPVVQESIPKPTKEQMEYDSLNGLYVEHRYPSKEAVPENMKQYITTTSEGFTRSGKKHDETTFAKVRVPQSEWEYLTQQRIERPTTAAPNVPVSEDFAGQNPVIETMPIDKKARPAEVVVPQRQSAPAPNTGRVAVEMSAEPQMREIPAMKQIPANLTPENIGRMSEEELAQHFDITPPAERIPDVGETMAASEPVPMPAPTPAPQPATMKSEYEDLMAGDRQTKTKDGVTYTRRTPFVKTEGETLVPTRPDVIVGNPTSVQFLESVVPGHYVFHPAGLSVPSHVNGKVNESYFLENPQGKSGQKGIDYVGDRIKYGSFDPKQMVGKDANAYMSAPKVILPTGEPIQGNTRAEFEQKIYQPENARQAEQYKNEILANAEYYGLDTPEKVAAFKAMKNPTISRVVDVDDATAQRLAMRHQDEAAWSKSPTDNSILRLSTMEPETEKKALRMIAAGLEGEEGDGKTLLQLLRKEDYRKDIALLLAGPKDQKKYAAYMDNMDNNLGANAIQDDLRNLVFGKDERTIRKFDGLTNKQKDVVNSNLGALLRLHDDPLFKDFKSAVDGLQAYNAAAQKQGKGLENWLKGSNAFGRAHSEDYSEAAQKLMLLMDESPAADVRKMLTEYLDIRKNTSGESMFGEEPIPYSTMFQRAIEKTGEGRLLAVAGAALVPDNDDPIYPGASITNREVRIVLGGAAIASLATHPQITSLLRNLKISAPETALRELTKVEPVIPGYVGTKLNPTKFTDADVSALVGKAKADGITDELLAHHLAFTRGEQYSRQHLEESRANLYGNQIDPEAEQAAADYLLKSLTHAHNGNMELPEMSDRLHTLALNTIDGADGVVGKNEYVQSNAAIKNPAAAHTATITQGREQTLGVPDEDYATVAKSVLDLDDLNQKGTWSDDLYFAATGKDETLQSALTKMDKREQLSPEEVQAWQKYEAEKLVWDDAIAKGTNENEWSGIEAIRTKFRDPIRADAFDRYVSTKAWETQMDNEVNAIAKENGFDPIPPPRVKSQALYSSVFPIMPGTWAAVKKSRLGQVALSSAFGYVASNAIFEDDKMYGGMTGKEAKLLMTATFGGLVGAAHISSYFFTKHAPIWMRTAVNNAMHPVDTVALHDVENVAAKKYGRGTEKFNQAVTELQAKLKRIDKGVRKTKNTTSAPWLAAIGHEEFAKIETAQVKAQNTGRLQKREIDLLHDKYKAFSSADKQIVNAAADAYDRELGLIRANKNLDAVGKDEAVKRVQAELEATWFKDKPTAKKAFDLYHEMAKHARQIDVESRLMKKFGLKWEQLPEKIAASRTLVEVQKDKVRELQQLYAMAEDPASKTAIRKDIHINNKIRENHETFATQLEYMRDLPAESQKYHYLPHYWDKNGAFKYAIKDEAGNMVEYRKFDTKAAADKWLKQFRADAAAGLHKNSAARVATSNFVKGQRDIRLTINDLVSAAYSEKTATLARFGLNREALFKALETLDEWTDLPLESRIKVYETLEDNITPESLRHILNEMWAPKDVHLEFRQMRKGYLDVDPKKQLDGTISKQEQRQLHDWVFGGLDKMITGGRLTLEKSAMLHEASNQLDQLGREGLSSSRYYSWLKDEFIPSLTNQDPIPAGRARKIGNVRSAMSMAKLVANPLHGASNIIYGSLATFAEAGIAHKGNVAKAAWYMMTSALDLPTGGKYSSPEMQKGIKLLEKHDYGETQFYNQALRSELGNNELVRKMMFASVKSEEFNNKMSSIVFMKTALNKGATVEEAVEYALKMRQRTQFAFTPWMTTGVERYIRKFGGGSGSVMLTLMGAAIRGAEHTLSIYSRAAANPKTAFVPAMAMLTAATMISGLYGDPWMATGMRTIELADELLADDDDTRLTKESFLEKCQRRVGDVAEKYGLPREKGENLWNTILQGVPARTTNINMSLDNNLSGMLSPVALSTATQIIKAGGAIISDQSWQEKMLNVTKPVTVLARTARAGLSLAEGHRVDNKGNPTTDKPYGMADAFKEVTTGTPADVAFAQRAKAAGGGDLQDQFSKEGYVKSMYNMPMLKVGNEKNAEQRQILTEKAPVIRRTIQSNYDKSSDARSKDLEDAIAWARLNKPFMNWIDRNGGADILGNVAQKAAPALARNIENWYAAQAAADAVNTTVGPIAKFSPKKPAVEDAIARLQKTAAEKANTPEKKAELRKLFIGLQQVKK